MARIYQINVSNGGVPKRPIDVATVSELGIEGDAHNDQRSHGGPERALCVYSIEHIKELQAEGHPVAPGTMGENVTTEGIDLSGVVPGDRFQLGQDVIVEVTRYTTPCVKISGSFSEGHFNRVSSQTNPGWSRFYVRVLVGGKIRTGDLIRSVVDSK